MTKRLLAVCLTGAMILSCAACGGGNNDAQSSQSGGTSTSTESTDNNASADAQEGISLSNGYADTLNTEKSDETLTIGISAEPDNLLTVSGKTQENSIAMIDGYLLDRLINRDNKTGEIVPGLATEWERVDDTHYKFTLRDDVKMVDGKLMTADDVLYTVKFAAEHAANLDVGKYYNVDECSAVDEHTVIIATKKVCAGFIDLLTQTPFGIISESTVEAAGGADAISKNPVVGSGKYTFSKWEAGQYIELTRNEDYWDPDYVGYYKTIRFVFINDNSARLMAVQSGDINVALDVPPAISYPQASTGTVNVDFFDQCKVGNIYFNTSKGAFADKAVREAAYWAIDKNSINQVGTLGLGQISDALFPASNEYYVDVYDEEQHVDIEKAKQILADAGYTDTIQVTALSQAQFAPIMTVVQENLRAIGIELTIESTDAGSYVSKAKAGEYDLLYGQTDIEYRTPSYLQQFESGAIEKGVIGGPKYSSPQMDADIDIIRQSFDDEEVKAALKDFMTIVKDEVLCLGINTQISSVVTSPNLTGLQEFPRHLIDCTQLRPVK